jgi:hypothetical protein
VTYMRMVIYMLDCDRRPCVGGTPGRPFSEDFDPDRDGLRGARKEAADLGWTRAGDLNELDICPACSKNR